MNYLTVIREESDRFRRAMLATSASTQVPTCPDWNADDLLWHLAEVQWFWGQIVLRGLTSADEVEGLSPERPDGRAELVTFFDRASEDLVRGLSNADPAAAAWTWAPEQSVGFILRRQAHEALIHRLDAELTAGASTPIDADLAADGVDEALRIMYGGLPPWGSFTPLPGRTLRLETTDTGHTWFITLGTFTGTDPSDGVIYDEPDLSVHAADDGSAVASSVSGTAADLDCWLWHRPVATPIIRSGDPTVLAELDTIIAPGIN